MDSDYFSQTQTGMTESQDEPTGIITAGTIHKVKMKNFMCHDNLEVKLNPRINFVIGKNGSGKSAIQTAVAIGLGGTALATNRGSSIKELIKHGRNNCTITIIINNQGNLAYNPKEYGSFIKVERTFSETSSCYKIKSDKDRLISNEKKELVRICDHYNIQPENPLCILQQDMARSFLNSSDPKKKYDFFLKASRLEDITNIYDDSISKVQGVTGNINIKFEVLREAFLDVMETKQKLKIMDDAKEKREECAYLEKELKWAEVNEYNLELKKLKRHFEKENQDMKKLEDELKEVQQNDTDEQMRALKSKIEEIDRTLQDARESVASARTKYMKQRETCNESGRKFKNCKENMMATKCKYQSCMSEIERLTSHAPEVRRQQERLKEELKLKEQELEALKAAESTAEHDRQQLEDTVDVSRRELQNCEQNLSNLKNKKGKIAGQLNDLRKGSSDMIVYGEAVVQIVEEIEKAARQKKFAKKPVGPIGKHIKVRDPKWAAAVENFLSKGFLSSFCVDNTNDSAVLARILKTVCSRCRASPPPIICSKFLPRVHDFTANQTGTREFSNLFQALDIDTPVVANCIIDQLEAETVLLIPNNKTAYDLLDEEHKVPINCKKAFTMTGDQFYPAPNYKSYSASRGNLRATLLQAKQEDLISELTLELNDQTQSIEKLEKEKQKIQRQLGELSTSMRRSAQELKNIKDKRFETECRINQISNEVTDAGPSTNVGFLEEEAKELKDQYEAARNECEELKAIHQQDLADLEEAKSVYENYKTTIDESTQKKIPIQINIQKLQAIMDDASSKERLIKHQMRDQAKRLEKIESKIKEIEELLASTRENASQVCGEEIKTRRSKDEVKRELNSVQTFLASLESQLGGNEEVLRNTLKERQAAFDAVNNHLNMIRTLVKKQSEALKVRKHYQSQLQRIMMGTAKHHFQIALKERNLEGKLEFDVPNKTLNIKIARPQKRGDGDKKLDTFSLSGGEKSFATVCFIMALWQEIELPFHFMDEFDVFMDGINRKIVIDMLLDHAMHSNQQYVFLTPLDASSIPENQNIQILRLEPPRK